MPICKKCGAEYAEDAQSCPVCGESLEKKQGMPFEVDADSKIYAILSYIGVLVLIPILCAKQSRFVRFHANQGLVLFICELIAAAVSAILWWIPVVGQILGLVIGLPLYLVTVVFMVIGIINAYGGKQKELPLIGQLTLLK
ncbi:MAG: DUF4870 domain-containing protein [Clostridia bacterium]|nr:DUF4870 domain-containing protein [Clostridia bacterium]